MKPQTIIFLRAVAVALGTILTAFTIWINSFDTPTPAPTPEPTPVVVVPDPPKPAEFTLATLGPTQAYAGHDLYFAVSGKRPAGHPENTYITVNAPTGITTSLPDIARTCCGNFMWEIDAEINTSVCLSLPASRNLRRLILSFRRRSRPRPRNRTA